MGPFGIGALAVCQVCIEQCPATVAAPDDIADAFDAAAPAMGLKMVALGLNIEFAAVAWAFHGTYGPVCKSRFG